MENQQHYVGQKADHVHQAGTEGSCVRSAEKHTQEVTQHDDRHPEIQQKEENDTGIAVREDAARFENDGQGNAAQGQHGHVLQEPGQEEDGGMHAHHSRVLSKEGNAGLSPGSLRKNRSCQGRQVALEIPMLGPAWPSAPRRTRSPAPLVGNAPRGGHGHEPTPQRGKTSPQPPGSSNAHHALRLLIHSDFASFASFSFFLFFQFFALFGFWLFSIFFFFPLISVVLFWFKEDKQNNEGRGILDPKLFRLGRGLLHDC